MSEAIFSWFTGRLPADWGTPQVTVDRDEITVLVPLEAAANEDETAGRLARWREQTREQRIGIAREAEQRFERKVAWGVMVGETRTLFTHLAVPVMTRLRQPERRVLDTLVDASVARSRAEALAWCVKLVGQHADQWLGELREAMASVEKVREQGPGL
jgi:hypothetical protein